MNNRTTVEQIKERLPIDEVIGSYVKLEKSGKSLKAKCPFHNEKSASFFVSPERGGYYCFGCGAKGDIFSFVEQFEGLDFRGALKVLAERAGVKLVANDRTNDERDKLFEIMEEATKYFENEYVKSKEAQAYVESRGIKDETRKSFRISWAPLGWNNVHNYLKGKGYSDILLEKAGLIKKKDNSDNANGPSSYYDRFRGRVMFPIADTSGRVIAFSGRILKDDGQSAKYLNSPDTPLYDKSAILFGLDKAKTEIRRLNYSILVEGQMDLVMSHQAGIKNTVASSGTALSDEGVNKEGIINNLGLVRRLSPNVIIAFDADEAGRKAAMRASGIALSLGMDVKIADIVGGKDPADLVKEDVELWRNVIKQAKPVIEFELANVLKETTDSRKVPRELRERVFPFVASIESSTDKSYFVKMIADRANIDEQAIWEDVRVIEKKLKTGLGNDTNSSSNVSNANKNVYAKEGRLDLVERRLFGLLFLMETLDPVAGKDFRSHIERIAGESFVQKMSKAESMKSDIAFEAEAFFGTDQTKFDNHKKELLANFEEDLVGQELIQAMKKLREAEREGNNEIVAEMAKKCQVLSMRKSDILKNKK
jgi:DNA primase